jgi:hypothetical protein
MNGEKNLLGVFDSLAFIAILGVLVYILRFGA